MTLRSLLHTVCTVLLVAAALQVHAEYPERQIRIIVPISAGSTTDTIARVVADKLRLAVGHPVVVENVPGAGGTIGTAMAAKAPADGYTLLIASSAHTVNPAIYKNLPYSTTGDFSAISVLATLPNILVSSPASNLKSLEDLVAQARAAPDKLTYGSGGVGSGAHMNAVVFLSAAKVSAMHVPFKGTSEVVNELLAGRIDFAFVPITTALPHLRAGKLQALAVGASRRTVLLHELRTTEEAGIAGSAHNEWVGMYARSGTPDAVLRRLNAEVTGILRDPSVSEHLAGMGASPAPTTPAEADAFVRSGIAASVKAVSIAGIPMN